MRLLLQFPEGLKKLALAKAKEYEALGHEVFISAAPCFGGCDIALDEAKAIKADKIIHFGHAEFMKVHFPIEYVEYPINVEYEKVMAKALAELKSYAKVGIVTTMQHVHILPKLRSYLEKHGKRVVIGRGVMTKYDGQILGCDTIAASSIREKVDCFLYFGGGFFHPLGMEVSKPVLIADPFSNTVQWIDVKEAEKRWKGLLTKAIYANSFGILVSTKVGQFNLDGARAAKKHLEAKGKRAEILVGNFFDFNTLDNFQAFDAYVNTACPRIRDDYERAKKPVLNLEDLAELLKLLH